MALHLATAASTCSALNTKTPSFVATSPEATKEVTPKARTSESLVSTAETRPAVARAAQRASASPVAYKHGYAGDE